MKRNAVVVTYQLIHDMLNLTMHEEVIGIMSSPKDQMTSCFKVITAGDNCDEVIEGCEMLCVTPEELASRHKP